MICTEEGIGFPLINFKKGDYVMKHIKVFGINLDTYVPKLKIICS